MASVAPAGTIPIRKQLQAYGVPDSFISYDPQTGNVRVGSQTIQPAANVQGTTYADPAQISAVAQRILAMQPKAPEGQILPPSAMQQATQRTLSALGQIAPGLEQVRSQLSPTFAQELAAQQSVADAWRGTAQTAGQFGAAPTRAPLFDEVFAPYIGQITEGRRASQAQEGLARERFEEDKKMNAAALDRLNAQTAAQAEFAATVDPSLRPMFEKGFAAGLGVNEIQTVIELDALAQNAPPGLVQGLELMQIANPKTTAATYNKFYDEYILANPNLSIEEAQAGRAFIDKIIADKNAARSLALRAALTAGLAMPNAFGLPGVIPQMPTQAPAPLTPPGPPGLPTLPYPPQLESLLREMMKRSPTTMPKDI